MHTPSHQVLHARPTELRLSKDYILWYSTWTWVLLTSVGPFIILTYLNLVIWRKLKEGRKRLMECSYNSNINVSQQQHVSNVRLHICDD